MSSTTEPGHSGAGALGREIAGWIALVVVAAGCMLFFADIQAVTRVFTGIDATSQRPAGERPLESQAGGFDRTVKLSADDNGHFLATASVNGRDIDVIVDTGATNVALTYEDAERIGIAPSDADYTHMSRTANGDTRVAPVMIDEITIGDITVKNVSGLVTEPGKLFQSLLGMTFLGELTRVDMRGRELVLEQ